MCIFTHTPHLPPPFSSFSFPFSLISPTLASSPKILSFTATFSHALQSPPPSSSIPSFLPLFLLISPPDCLTLSLLSARKWENRCGHFSNHDSFRLGMAFFMYQFIKSSVYLFSMYPLICLLNLKRNGKVRRSIFRIVSSFCMRFAYLIYQL